LTGWQRPVFWGRKLGESVNVWKRILADPECSIFFGLSGCTFDEAISWGKESAGTMQVQVHVDATIALPLVISALVSGGVKRVRRRNPIKEIG
jgi:deoxyhypusine synthase